MQITISVVVPCYPPHQKYISTLIEQLNNQTVLPDEIIIALSETNDTDTKKFYDTWSLLTSIPLKVVNQEIKAFAAVNRNYGAAHAAHEYIQFLDADDTYHSQLISTVKKYISEYKPDALLYHLTDEKVELESDKEPVRKVFYSSKSLFVTAFPDGCRVETNEHYNRKPQLFINSTIHHGHLCIKYDIWAQSPQENLQGREDSVYIRTLLWNWHLDGEKTSGVIIIPEVLTYYKMNQLNKVLESKTTTD